MRGVSRDPNFELHNTWTAPHEVTGGRWSLSGHNSESCFHLNFHLKNGKKHENNKHRKNCESCPTQVTWKVKFKCKFCRSCLSCPLALTTMTVTQSVCKICRYRYAGAAIKNDVSKSYLIIFETNTFPFPTKPM